MSAIVHSVEIGRPPDEVFAYLDDIARHGEWQDNIVSVEVEGGGPTHVGTRVKERRKMGGREQAGEWEITAHDPPRSYAFRGLSGPLRPVGGGTLEPLDGGTRTRLTFSFDFEAHGIGHLLRPLARSQARKAIPPSQAKLKEILESRRD